MGEHRPAVTIESYTDVPSGDENALKAAASKQPVAIAIEADKSAFQLYSGGVLDNPGCGQQLDHGVLLVGYGTDSGKDYWKVKNSWVQVGVSRDTFEWFATRTNVELPKCHLTLRVQRLPRHLHHLRHRRHLHRHLHPTLTMRTPRVDAVLMRRTFNSKVYRVHTAHQAADSSRLAQQTSQQASQRCHNALCRAPIRGTAS